jgi:orotate phosphoribosyltransferase
VEQYKKDFIAFMVKSKVLTFGDFTTKSGRKTPYFINTGNYKSGSQLGRLGEFYAKAIDATFGKDYSVLFGPAYKGISLAVATAIASAKILGHDVNVSFNRKEAKDHGEGGTIIGHKPMAGDRIVIVDDVVTAGTSVRESMTLLSVTPGITCLGCIVSVDRKEKGPQGISALAEVSRVYDMKAAAIVTIDDIVGYLHNQSIDGNVVLTDELVARISEYRAQYGVA